MTKKEFLKLILERASKLALECEDDFVLFQEWNDGELWERYLLEGEVITHEDVLGLFADPIYMEVWTEVFIGDGNYWNPQEETVSLILGINPIEVRWRGKYIFYTNSYQYKKIKPFEYLDSPHLESREEIDRAIDRINEEDDYLRVLQELKDKS